MKQAEIGGDWQKAQALLQAGQLVAIPTETVYGLAGNGFNPEAVARIFEVKNRPHFNPLILHIGRIEQVFELTSYLPQAAQALMERFWPGPLTLLLPKSDRVPDLVTAGSERVALRMPAHPLTHSLLQQLDFPLAAPSANPFGYVSPTTAQHVAQQLGDKIPYILDGGPATVGVESTILGWEEDKPVIYRLGGLALEDLEPFTGPLTLAIHSGKPLAPGMLGSHYAPGKPLFLDPPMEWEQTLAPSEIAYIRFCDKRPDVSDNQQIILSPSGSLSEAASRLFDVLRQLDSLPQKYAIAQSLPEQGLGRAINDRLRRASTDYATFDLTKTW